MHLDHISFAAGPGGLAATTAEIEAALGATFLDGGDHPRFGTTNKILPLKNRQYLEVVATLDHPASDRMAFGKAVRERSEAGGGWLHWCISVDDMTEVEHRIGRHAVPGNRHRPDGFNLEWVQIGTTSAHVDPQLPYVTKWLIDPSEHPSQMEHTEIELIGLEIAGDPHRVEDYLGEASITALETVEVNWSAPRGTPGIMSATFRTPGGDVKI